MPVAEDTDHDIIARNSIAIRKSESSDQEIFDIDAMFAELANQSPEDRDAELIESIIADMDKRTSDGLATSTDAAAPAKWSKKVTEPVAKPKTEKVTKRLRKSDVKDKETLETLQKMESEAAATKAHSVAKSQPPKSPLSALRKPSNAKAPKASASASSKSLPVWDHTGDRVKVAISNRVLAGSGGVAFSLNLSETEIALAHKHAGGFTDYFKRKLDRYLNRNLGGRLGVKRWFWFAVDVSDRKRLHLHGGIEYPGQNMKELESVLCVVGGEDWKSAKKGDRQVDFQPMWGPDGWVRYDLRNSGAVKKLIEGRTFTICRPLRNLAKKQYNHARRGNVFWV